MDTISYWNMARVYGCLRYREGLYKAYMFDKRPQVQGYECLAEMYAMWQRVLEI